MVKPTDLDVVFYDRSSTDQKQPPSDPRSRPANDWPAHFDGTGNRIFRALLETHHDQYYAGPPPKTTTTKSEWQKGIRKRLLGEFYKRIATIGGTRVGAANPEQRKAQFYIHMQKGETTCFAKVCFRNRIDEKIKESFERFHREMKVQRSNDADDGNRDRDRDGNPIPRAKILAATAAEAIPSTSKASTNEKESVDKALQQKQKQKQIQKQIQNPAMASKRKATATLIPTAHNANSSSPGTWKNTDGDDDSYSDSNTETDDDDALLPKASIPESPAGKPRTPVDQPPAKSGKRKKKRTSRFRGVSFFARSKNTYSPWRVDINKRSVTRSYGKQYVGVFHCEEEAARAYDRVIRSFGKPSDLNLLNFPTPDDQMKIERMSKTKTKAKANSKADAGADPNANAKVVATKTNTAKNPPRDAKQNTAPEREQHPSSSSSSSSSSSYRGSSDEDEGKFISFWNKAEHKDLLRAVQLYGTNDWSKVASFVATRNVRQTKSYAMRSCHLAREENVRYVQHWDSVPEYQEFIDKLPSDWTVRHPSWDRDGAIQRIRERFDNNNGKRRGSPKQQSPQKKQKISGNGETNSKVNTSNWGRFRNFLFGGSPKSNEAEDDKKMDNSASKKRERSASARCGNSVSLEPMPEITKSPYEGNQSAEIQEEQLEAFKKLLRPCGKDQRMNPLLEKYLGEPLARAIFRARLEIIKSGLLHNADWKRGKIGDSNLGWIPRRQLLLCLSEERFAASSSGHSVGEGDDTVQTVAKKLECFDLVILAMREWNLRFEFPELYSNKDVQEFVFKTDSEENKLRCYRCQIFVARVYATLILLKQETTLQVKPSLMTKVKACLAIMNQHVQAHASGFERLIRKQRKLKEIVDAAVASVPNISSILPAANGARTLSDDPARKKPPTNGIDQTADATPLPCVIPPARGTRSASSPVSTRDDELQARPRYSIHGTCEEREATLMVSFVILKKEVEKFVKMTELFRKILRERPDALKEEIRENLEREMKLEAKKKTKRKAKQKSHTNHRQK